MRCANYNFENPEGKNFCGKCGTKLAGRCSNCGAENPPDKHLLRRMRHGSQRSRGGRVFEDYLSVSAALSKRPACDFAALARVSNQSAISVKPSSRAIFAIAGYISVYS